MSLQRRLTLYFVFIVILPLAVAGVLVQRVVVGELSHRSLISLRPALDSAVTSYNGQIEVVEPETRSLIATPRFARLLEDGPSADLDRHLEELLRASDVIDFLIVQSTDGQLLSAESEPADFLSGFEPPSLSEIASTPPGAGNGFDRSSTIPVRIAGTGSVGRVIGGFWLDKSVLTPPTNEDVDLSLVAGDRVIASTAAIAQVEPVDISRDAQFEVGIAGPGTGEAEELPGEMAIVASTLSAPIDALSRQLVLQMLAVLLLAIIGTTLLATYLSRLLTRDLGDLADAARAMAEGRFDMPIPVRSKDEVGRLAIAFNEMRDKLSVSYSQLSSSRDQLQRAIRRVGETLRSTHNMTQMLESILNTAADAVGVDAATLWMFTPRKSVV